jgi:hypothetical protein
VPLSAVDAISPALEHTKRQLLQPFRFGQWIRLAFVGLLAGELGSGGGCNPPTNFHIPHHPGSGPVLAGIDPVLFAVLIAVVVVAAFVLGLVLMYISSVMRFVLFDSVLKKECRIREYWNARQAPGWRYFLWKLLYTLVTFGIVIVLIGIPAGLAFIMGWFNQPKQHVLGLVLGGIFLFFVFVILVVAIAVIYVLTKDFVIPQMALEEIGAIEAWQRLWLMMKAETGSYAAYIGMKIVLALGAAIVLGIVGAIFALIILVPAAGVAIATVLAAKAAGVGWTVYTITLAVVAGCALLAVFLFMTSLISVPAIVFFPAYSIYFFAARYPALGAALYPAPPIAPLPVVPETTPSYEPPPLPPAPDPTG